MEIQCNRCWKPLQEKAFRTPCLHAFCTGCSEEIFGSSPYTACPVCTANVRGSEDVKEFQVVGGPIPDAQLGELQNMLFAVALANGTNWVSRQVEVLCKFQISQLEALNDHQIQKNKKIEQDQHDKEQFFMNQQLETQHAVSSLETKCQQLEKSLSASHSNSDALQKALEDKNRQLENWKLMYESSKDSDGGVRRMAKANAMRKSSVPRPQQNLHQQHADLHDRSSRKPARSFSIDGFGRSSMSNVQDGYMSDSSSIKGRPDPQKLFSIKRRSNSRGSGSGSGGSVKGGSVINHGGASSSAFSRGPSDFQMPPPNSHSQRPPAFQQHQYQQPVQEHQPQHQQHQSNSMMNGGGSKSSRFNLPSHFSRPPTSLGMSSGSSFTPLRPQQSSGMHLPPNNGGGGFLARRNAMMAPGNVLPQMHGNSGGSGSGSGFLGRRYQ